MPKDWLTWWTEVTFRHSDVPYWCGPGGVTPPAGNTGSPGELRLQQRQRHRRRCLCQRERRVVSGPAHPRSRLGSGRDGQVLKRPRSALAPPARPPGLSSRPGRAGSRKNDASPDFAAPGVLSYAAVFPGPLPQDSSAARMTTRRTEQPPARLDQYADVRAHLRRGRDPGAVVRADARLLRGRLGRVRLLPRSPTAWRSRAAITACGHTAPTRRTGRCGCSIWYSARMALQNSALAWCSGHRDASSVRRRRRARSVLGAARLLVLAHRLDAARVPERQARLQQHPGPEEGPDAGVPAPLLRAAGAGRQLRPAAARPGCCSTTSGAC